VQGKRDKIKWITLGKTTEESKRWTKKTSRRGREFSHAIEGKFGQAKRRFGLNLCMTKLPETSETSIAITFLVVNLSRLLRQFFGLFLSFLIWGRTKELRCRQRFNKNYVKSRFTKVKLITWATNYWHLIA